MEGKKIKILMYFAQLKVQITPTVNIHYTVDIFLECNLTFKSLSEERLSWSLPEKGRKEN